MLSQYYNYCGRILFISKFNITNTHHVSFLKELVSNINLTQKIRAKYKLILIFNIFVAGSKPAVIGTGNTKLLKIPQLQVTFSKKLSWVYLNRFLLFIFPSQDENTEIFLEKKNYRTPALTIHGCNTHFEIDKVLRFLRVEWFEKIHVVFSPKLSSFSYRHTEFFLNFFKLPVFFK